MILTDTTLSVSNGTGTAFDRPDDSAFAKVLPRFAPERVLDACRGAELDRGQPGATGWRDARVIEALYHPGRYVRVAYALLHDSEIPRERYWPDADIIYLHHAVRHPLSRRGELLCVDGHDFEIYRFPNDRRIRGMRRLTSREDILATWAQWLQAGGDGFRLDPSSLRRALVRYVPEQKCVIQFRVRGDDGAGGKQGKRCIAARAMTETECRRLVTVQRAVTKQSAAACSFVVPPVVGVDADRGMLAVKWLHGERLIDTLQGDRVPIVMERVAAALADFHRLKVPGLSAMTGATVLRRAGEALADLTAADPGLTDACGTIARALARHLDESHNVFESESVTLHNDFHWDQMRLRPTRLALFDVDRMCRGPSEIDVANFAVQLRLLGHRLEHPVSIATGEMWSAAFLEAWRNRGGRAAPPRLFGCCAALSALELARGMLRHLRPGWRRLAGHCLAVADENLTDAGQMVNA